MDIMMISQLRFVHKQVYSILEVRCFAFRRYPTESMAIVVRRSIVRTYKLHQRQNPHEPAAGQAILSNLIKLQSIPEPPIPSNRKSGCTMLHTALHSVAKPHIDPEQYLAVANCHGRDAEES